MTLFPSIVHFVDCVDLMKARDKRWIYHNLYWGNGFDDVNVHNDIVYVLDWRMGLWIMKVENSSIHLKDHFTNKIIKFKYL